MYKLSIFGGAALNQHLSALLSTNTTCEPCPKDCCPDDGECIKKYSENGPSYTCPDAEAGYVLAAIFGTIFLCACCCVLYNCCKSREPRRPNPLLTIALLTEFGRTSNPIIELNSTVPANDEEHKQENVLAVL